MAAETEDSFDMEAFIEEIHGLPCIWDYTSEAHNNRLEKAKAWESLCYRFCDNYDAMDKKEKAEFVTKLQRKWRSLRDSYNRELKKQNSGIPKHRQYLYFTNLHFLRPLAERRIAENFIGDFDEDDFMTQHSTDESKPPTKRKRTSAPSQQEPSSSKQQLSAYLPEFGPKVDMTVEPTSLPPSQPLQQQQGSDGDWHFLLSLYEHFKNIDSRSKLVAKMEILSVIHKHTRTQPPWGYEGGHQYNNGYSVSYNARQSSGPVQQPRSSSPIRNMLREILLVSFLLGAAIAAQSANQYVDNVIQTTLPQELVKFGLSPATLPNFSVRFGPVSRSGNQSQADFIYGNATGFNQVRRKGDCQGPRNVRGEITINCTLSVFPLVTAYRVQIRNGSQLVQVRSEGRVEETLVSVVIAGHPQNYLGTVKSFRIDRLGQINPTFSPLPAAFNRYVPELQNAYRSRVSPDLYGLLQHSYSNVIARAMAYKPMPRQ